MLVYTDQIDEKIAQFSISHFLVNTVKDIQMTEQFHKVTKVYTLCSGLNTIYICANAIHVVSWRNESVCIMTSANCSPVGSISRIKDKCYTSLSAAKIWVRLTLGIFWVQYREQNFPKATSYLLKTIFLNFLKSKQKFRPGIRKHFL